jgi:tRNA(Ile)-lysidine synthase
MNAWRIVSQDGSWIPALIAARRPFLPGTGVSFSSSKCPRLPRMQPDAALVQRFRRDLEALLPVPDRLGAAVSGGPDSLALLLLAAAAFPGRVHAATVDHGLRPGSAVEALHVEDIAARAGAPHAILEISVPDGPAGLQAEARAARYAALESWAARERLPLLLTAHHADDQAETILMRLQRGAGIGGLSGIRPLRPLGPGLTLARPLLGWTKAELVRLVRDAGLEPADDPSNRDPRFDRTRARALLAANPALEPARLARAAAALREADEALDWQAGQLFATRCAGADGEWRLDPAELPRELRRRLLARAIAAACAAHGLAWTGDEDVEGLLRTLESGGTATRAGLIARGGPVWRLALAPPRRGAA